MRKISTYQDVVNFHGHSCPGLAIGYRVALIALRELRTTRAEDEELVAIVENNACGVDAIQKVCGCTFGKGNLIFRDYGKDVYTFFNRRTGKGIRIYAEAFYKDDEKDKRFVTLSKKTKLTEDEKREIREIRERRVEEILNFPAGKFIRIKPSQEKIPHKARILSSVRCEICRERVMETCIERSRNRLLCHSCLSKSEVR